jgi:nitrate/nitrite-specific signal transduction histidine kinase
MRERVERLGGTFEIDSTPGGGTLVRVAIPPGQASTAAVAAVYA